MSLQAKRTAAAGGADATVTSASALFAVIDSLLTTAGWTVDFDYATASAGSWTPSTILPVFNSNYSVGTIVTNSSNYYQCIQSGTASTNPTGPTGEGQDITDGTVHWRFITQTAGNAKVYKSTGESGNEILWCRVVCVTSATPAINVRNYQFFDPSTTQFGFNAQDFGGVASPNLHQYTYTGGNTVNFAMVADKDSWMVITNDSANNRRLYGAGRITRAPNTIATFFTANAQVTAGLNKVITVSSGNPVAAGYAIGDRIFVIGQEANNVSPHNQIIPIYAAVITDVTTTTITIDNAQATTAAGALVGADPQPYFAPTTNANSTFGTGSTCPVAYIWDNTVTNIWSGAASPGQGYQNLATPALGLLSSALTETDPNNRTSRLTMGEILLAHSAAEIMGAVPKYYQTSRLTDTLWNIGRSVKEATPRDYVLFPANTATPASQIRSFIGPFATSGSATFSVDLQTQESNTWIEATLNPTTDKTGLWRTTTTAMQFIVGDPTQRPGLVGQLFTENDAGTSPDKLAFDDVLPQGVLHVNSVHDRTIEGQGSPLRTGGEVYPFDTSQTTQGGSGSSFNSGFN